jgi:excisionase family DNA binding protein
VRQHSSAAAGPGGGSLLDIDRVAQTLGVTPRFVRRLVAERRIPFIKVGKFVRFDPFELDAWIEGKREAAKRSATAFRSTVR